MTTEDLKQQITELQAVLREAGQTDIHSRDMLGSLMEDIVVLASAPERSAVDSDGVKQQLEQQATDFESQHPRVAAMMRQIMDLLAKMGI